MQKNRSGQYVYFTLVSALSGNPVTGASGSISGRKSLDGLSGMIVLSGNIIELGGGSYRANLFDFDNNGDQAGYLFTSSGCAPVQYQFDMIDGNMSGRVYPASGANVVVPPATLSGVVVNSGLFVTVPIATISGATANSGLFVTVPIATISGTIANSGLTVTVLPATISGVFATVPIATISGLTANSGLFTTILPANLSGVIANSGLFVTVVTAPIASGQVFLASGHFLFVSGQYYLTSGAPADFLKFNYSGITGESQRSLLNATRKLINKFDTGATASGYLTVFKEDDSTQAYQQAITATSNAPQIISLDTQ